jgi:DUF4097 and DUF4098 domain-containing protein YvlB
MRWAWASLLLLSTGGSFAEGQRKINQGFRVDPTVAVRIHNLVGTTTVTGWDRDSIHAIGSIPSNGGSFYGGGGGVVAKLGIEGQDLGVGGPGATLEVRVPRSARVWIKSATASVHLADLSGEVEVGSVTGSITLSGAPRVATLETIDGELTITGSATVVRARTGSGAVRVEGARGDLAINTIQGPVTVVTNELLAGRIETVSGTVHVSAGYPPNGQLEVETHDGTVTLSVPRSVDARFDLSTVKGSIVTKLDEGAEQARDRSARFSVGKKAGAGRGAAITVRTFSGRIRIDARGAGS